MFSDDDDDIRFNSNTTGVTCGAGTTIPSGAPKFTPDFWRVSCCSIFIFFVFFLLTIVMSVLFLFTASNYPFGFLWSVLSFTASKYPFGIVWSVLLWFMASNYPFGILWPVLLWFTASNYPFGILDLRRLITPLVFSNVSCSDDI